MILLEYTFSVIGVLFLLFLVYYVFLAIVSLWPSKTSSGIVPSLKKFTVLIPAHNEDKVIKQAIESVKSVSYPAQYFEIVVIADNCKDRTAEIARDSGVECLERDDKANPGKGQALNWAFSMLQKRSVADAFVIIDADTIVQSNLLEVMNQHLARGAKVIQAYYDISSPESSPMASFTFLGFVISRNLKYRGRSRLGWSVNLLGNGMCLSREVIERFGWPAFSISEDLEYQLQLLMNGIRGVFAPEAKVYSAIPSSLKSYHRQRSRWDIGKYRLRNRYVPLLFSRGLREREFAFWDAFLELLIPPYTIYVGSSFLLYLIYLVAFYEAPGVHFYLWTVQVVGISLYTMIGLVLAAAPVKVYLNLLYAPFFLIWRLAIACESLFAEGKTWVKTERA